MKIIVEKIAETTFGHLNLGEFFWPDDDGRYDEDEIFIVVESDYGLGTGETYYGYAVALKSGELCGFGKDNEVVRYDLNITARPIA